MLSPSTYKFLDRYVVGQWEPSNREDLELLKTNVREMVNKFPFAQVEEMEEKD